MARETVRRKLVGSTEQGERDREVETGPLLAEIGGGEVDRDPAERPLELGRGDAAADTVLRFLAGAIGEADDRERGRAALHVSLDLDAARLEAYERMRDRAGEHVATVGAAGAAV